MREISERHESKVRLLDAALVVIRTKGYAATRVEDVCEAAGLTKGSFFHHFAGKEELAVAAAQRWTEVTTQVFAGAPYHLPDTAVDRLLAYVDFRVALLQGELPQYTCLAGMLIQETFESHPAIREAAAESIRLHAASLEADIAAAMHEKGLDGQFSPCSLALYTQSVVQGALLLAKAFGGPQVAAESLGHLRRYLELLFA